MYESSQLEPPHWIDAPPKNASQTACEQCMLEGLPRAGSGFFGEGDGQAGGAAGGAAGGDAHAAGYAEYAAQTAGFEARQAQIKAALAGGDKAALDKLMADERAAQPSAAQTAAQALGRAGVVPDAALDGTEDLQQAWTRMKASADAGTGAEPMDMQQKISMTKK